MPLNLAVTQRAQYADANGKPLKFGRVTYLDPLTNTPKSVYADPNGQVELSNPLDLDIGGWVPVSGVFYAPGNYTLVVEECLNPLEAPVNRQYAEVWTMPLVPGSTDTTIAGEEVVYLSSVEDIKYLTPGTFSMVYAANYYRNNRDQGGGWFRWYPNSTASTDLGVTFALDASPGQGRVVRDYEGNVRSAWFGVCPGRNDNMSSRIIQAHTWATAQNQALELSSGIIDITGSFNLEGGTVIVKSGFVLNKLSGSPIQDGAILNLNADVIVEDTENAFVINPANIVIGGNNSNSDLVLYPEWWQATGDGTADDYTAIALMNRSNGIKTFRRTYNAAAIGSTGTPELVIDRSHFVKGSRLLCRQLFKLESVSVEPGALWVIQGRSDYSFDTVSLGCTPHAHWLFNLTPNQAELNGVLAIAAATGGYLVWDYPGEFSLPASATDSTVYHSIAEGTTLLVNGDVLIGTVVAGDYKVFSTSSNGVISNQSIANPKWWGAGNMSDPVVNRVSLYRAISSLATGGKVDLRGMYLDMGDDTIWIAGNEFTISSGSLYGSSADGIMVMDGCIARFIDAKVSGALVATNGTKFYATGCEFSGVLNIAGNTVVLNGNRLSGFSYFGVSGTEQLVVSGNSIRGCNAQFWTGKVSAITGNTFTDMINPGTSYGGLVRIHGGDNLTLTGNSLYYVSGSASPKWITAFRFEGSGQSIQGLTAHSNTVHFDRNGFIATRLYNFGATGYATYGHKAVVKNNAVSGDECYNVGTEYHGTYTQKWMDMIFPVNTYPTKFTLACSNGASLTPSLTGISAGGGDWTGYLQISGTPSGQVPYWQVEVGQ